MDKPKISIITVVFNAGLLLEKTLKSIISQNYPHIEYVIIDGGSTDGTLDVIQSNAEHISFWSSEPDKGIYDAMNKGLKNSTGDYIWLLNAGDEIYSPDTLDKVFSKGAADAYYGDVAYIDEKGDDLGTRTLKTPRPVLSWKDMIKGMVVSHQSFIVRRDRAANYDLRCKYVADVDWMIRSLKNCNAVINTNLILSKFLVGGFSKRNIIKSNRERFT